MFSFPYHTQLIFAINLLLYFYHLYKNYMWVIYHPSLLKYLFSDNLILFFPEGIIALDTPNLKFSSAFLQTDSSFSSLPQHIASSSLVMSGMCICTTSSSYLRFLSALAHTHLHTQDHLCPSQSRQNSPFCCHLELTALFAPLFLTWRTSLFTEIQSSFSPIMFT